VVFPTPPFWFASAMTLPKRPLPSLYYPRVEAARGIEHRCS